RQSDAADGKMRRDGAERSVYRDGKRRLHRRFGHKRVPFLRRSEAYIRRFYNQNLAAGYDEQTALEMVLSDTAYPGTSEHQTGLCCDMHNYPSATVEFKNEDAYKWLTDNAWKFGFILRYPEDKVSITGYTFEPWHYRFVGRYHAERIHALGFCLEEYLDMIGG
ncbi:MAG: M15 family metallopeptidase, partial [Clostridia bacterium]|nr:M15 family metallopeptidase [Clostridia bacterium]